MTTWTYIGTKSDAEGLEWNVYKKMDAKGKLFRRTNCQNSHNYTRSLYWREGTFFEDGKPRWVVFRDLEAA